MRESPRYRELYELQFAPKGHSPSPKGPLQGWQKEPAAGEAASGGVNGKIEPQNAAAIVAAPASAGRSEAIVPECAAASSLDTETL
jgi:hypothetical protein